MANEGEVKIHVSADTAEAERDLNRVSKAQERVTSGTPGSPAPASAATTAGREAQMVAAAKARIQELYRHAAAYEDKGIPQAAASARADARAIERDLARHARERAAAERAVTREVREQVAEKKAGIGGSVRLANAVSLGQDLVQGGPQAAAGGLMQAGMGGGPVAMAAAVAAAVGTAIATTLAREGGKDKAQDLGVQQSGFMRSYRTSRQAGIFGSSAGLVSEALAATDEIEERKSQRGQIAERARVKWYDPSSWTWGGLRKNEGMREQEVNEAQIEQAEKERAAAIEKARRKYMAEEGGLEMRALRGRAERTLEGSREAFKAELGGDWLAKYKSVLQQSGDEGMAKEMADLTVGNKVRDLQASAGAGLVDARSGGAGVAAAAQWAQQAFPDMVGELRNLHATVRDQANPLEKQSK